MSEAHCHLKSQFEGKVNAFVPGNPNLSPSSLEISFQ